MHKNNIISRGKELSTKVCIAGFVLFLTGCANDESTRESWTEVPETSEAVTVSVDAEISEESVQVSPEKKTEQTDVAETETSPLLLWEYEGYVDECIGYTWCGEFADKDFDGDGKTDRLYRTCDADRQIAEYTIEFGNGRRIQVPEGWNTGFPHIQAGDTDNDGEPEVLFTLTYDTSTDPMAFGDMWLFDYDEGSGEYRQTELPLAAGENGAKEITVSYDKPQGNVVTIKVNQTGFTESVSLEEGYLQYWWSDETVIEDETVYHAALVKNGDKTILRCFAEVFTRGVGSISFDLIYKDGAYRVENTEYGVYPENW